MTVTPIIGCLFASALAGMGDPPLDLVKFCSPHSEKDLRLYGFQLEVPRLGGSATSNLAGAPNVETVLDNGDPSNRVDLVFVGDGFTAADLSGWPAVVVDGYERLFDYEPFTRYSSYFNVHRVDVISNESGVDNDPDIGVERDTALDMAFWCGNIERLLCVNTTKAWEQALYANDVDQVIAVGNSSKYGGAGYPGNDLGTYAGYNSVAVEVFIHELGHALGDLADEYDYGGSETYSGPEFYAANASIMPEEEMEDSGLKWDAWIGSDLADVGTHGCFEGCNYSVYGAYRPSSNSMMRSLAQPFNSPSREQLIRKIYEIVTLVDDVEPTSSSIAHDGIARAFTVHPSAGATRKRWYLDGVQISGEYTDTLDLSTIDLGPAQELTLRIWDPTPMVRDEAMRDALMTETYTWQIQGNPADINGDGVINGADLSIVLGFWGSAAPGPDINNDGIVDGADIALVLGSWS
jgi:hypothetical protein